MGTIIRATVLYWVLLLMLRVIPRRTGNIMTPFEFILIFLIGGMAIQMVIADDRSLVNALLGVTAVCLNHVIVATLKQHSPKFGRFSDGTPVVVYEEGRWLDHRMNQVRVQAQDVLTAARQQGVNQEQDMKYAIVERNGSISIIKKGED
jgi:uncharacterized membrane protein YcaP (DUF421 family)